MVMERDALTPAPVLLKEKEAVPAWQAAFKVAPLPDIAVLAQEAQLPAVVPVALSRSAVAQGDTMDGAIMHAPLDANNAAALRADPRVDHLRRMLARDTRGLRLTSTATPGVEPALALEPLERPSDPRAIAAAVATPVGAAVAERNTKIPGRVALPDPREPSAQALSEFTKAAIERRSQGLPALLRARMEQMRDSLDSVRTARKMGLGTDRDVLAHTADVAERAFVVSEGAKPAAQRQQEAKEGRVDALFAVAATASRAASREGYKDAFQRGLVSDVVACEQGARLHEGRPARRGDDWVGAAGRLHRVGLIDSEDARAQVAPSAVPERGKEPQEARIKEEKDAIKEAFADPAAKQKAKDTVKDEMAKEDKPKLSIKHEKPPEATADNSVSQVGLSGAYLAAEVGRDNRNATRANKMEADFQAEHDKRAAAAVKQVEDKPRAEFARAATLESAGVKAQQSGQPARQVTNVLAQAAASANAGTTQVSAQSRVRVARKIRPEEQR